MVNKSSITNHFRRKAWVFLGFLLVFSSNIFGQNQSLADSLDLVYVTGNFKEQDRLNIILELAVNHVDPEKSLVYSEKLIEKAQELDSTQYLYNGLLQKGNALKAKGDLTEALRIYIEAAEQAIDEKSYLRQGSVYVTIADVYSDMGNHNNAVKYYKNAIDIIRKENDSNSLATALFNAGDEYLNVKKYDSAKIFFEESTLIFKNINFEIGMAYNLGNMGVIYASQGKYLLAKENINEAIAILEDIKMYPPISDFLITLSDIYADQNDLTGAFEYAQRSLEIAQRYGLKKQISETNLKLSQLYEQDGNLPESFKYYKDHIIYKDSVNNIQSIQKMADLRTNFEIEKKEDEILVLEKEAVISDLESKRQKTVSYFSIGGFVLVFLLAIGLYRRYAYIKKTNVIIQTETDRSEKLLHNILPEETALELKQNGKVAAKKFDSVTVMFTDFKEFTRFSGKLSPEVLVKSVDFYFSKFDAIMEKYGLEKIKTIGDAYMCAGGLPFPSKDHADRVIQAAFEIIAFMEASKKSNTEDIKNFEIRIGINTGPVVAGVVGIKKFAYDIWGDSVNVASRMESASEPGKVNISENTYQLIKDRYDCSYRGEIDVKNKGMMKMYFVDGKKLKESDEVLIPDKIEV